MPLTLITAPSIEPVTRDEAKAHMNIAHTADDALIDNLITGARQYIEDVGDRQFISATWEWAQDDFPESGGSVRLPRSPLQTITSVKYTDTAGDEQTWGSANYIADIRRQPGRVWQAYSVAWPATRPIPNAVIVRFVAGDGDAATDVVESSKIMIKLLVAHLYENREATVEKTLTKVPLAFDSLFRNDRVFVFS